MKKFLLHKPRCGRGNGIGHSFKTWCLGLTISSRLDMEWVKAIDCLDNIKLVHGTSAIEFLDFFGLNEEVQNEKFYEIYKKYNIVKVPDSHMNIDDVEGYIKKNYNNYDGFLLDWHPMRSVGCDSKTDWFIKRKKVEKSLCDENYLNICLAIRRGDRILTDFKIESDEWFLDHLAEVWEQIDDPRPRKVFLFAETYNKTWHDRSPTIKNRQIEYLKKNNGSPAAFSLLKDFQDKNFHLVEKTYVNNKGEPNDIESMFSKYNAKLYLNHDIFSVIDTLIEADIVINKAHGSASLRWIYKDLIVLKNIGTDKIITAKKNIKFLNKKQ